jgi:hypothetical protein
MLTEPQTIKIMLGTQPTTPKLTIKMQTSTQIEPNNSQTKPKDMPKMLKPSHNPQTFKLKMPSKHNQMPPMPLLQLNHYNSKRLLLFRVLNPI